MKWIWKQRLLLPQYKLFAAYLCLAACLPEVVQHEVAILAEHPLALAGVLRVHPGVHQQVRPRCKTDEKENLV